MRLSPIALIAFFLTILVNSAVAQLPSEFQWSSDGKAFYQYLSGEVMKVSLPDFTPGTLIAKNELTQAGKPLAEVKGISISDKSDKVLLFANTRRVWRYETRGDYWVFDLTKRTLTQIGKSRPEASLMYAKLSPDGKRVAYVSQNNIYVEDLDTGTAKQLTSDGTDRLINGTFDWAYEEEFDCRDGFRWSPDSKSIAYWQIDARKIRNFLMINNTDSIYSYNVPVQYPKVGETPSPYRIGVVDVNSAKTRWMNLPGDPANTYVPRMEFTDRPEELVLQQLNRKQNESKLLYVNTLTGKSQVFYEEKDKAWIEVSDITEENPTGWNWLSGHNEFVWMSEKDGWRHAYRISRDGKEEKLITNGSYDVIKPLAIDETSNSFYFLASPGNATQAYLYRTNLDGTGSTERVSPLNQTGTHEYMISPDAKIALHIFSNAKTPPVSDWVSLPDHRPVLPSQSRPVPDEGTQNIEFLKVTTQSGVELDAWIIKPKQFDPSKKYPVLFYVYGEPASSTVRDAYGTGRISNYMGDPGGDGYVVASIDNRGTPSPKGKEWRKAIYRNIGIINIKDQAEGAQAMMEKYPFIDRERVAVFGHSGGGSTTLNLLFQYPNIYQTGISIAAVANQLTYDNIYQERYMGLPQENLEDFVNGSPITHARHLKGNLLYIHGTGDDNVHYQNAELLINELVRHEKQFQFMAYPNRTHGIKEGEGTVRHMTRLFTDFLKKHCPPGPR